MLKEGNEWAKEIQGPINKQTEEENGEVRRANVMGLSVKRARPRIFDK